MKSHAREFLYELAETIYQDATAMCPVDVFDVRDIETIRERLAKEGDSFLTITLPEFSRDFERSLELGEIGPTLFRAFRKRGAIPAFLQGMLVHLFCPRTGRLKDVEADQNSKSAADSYQCGSRTGGAWCACRSLNKDLQRTRPYREDLSRCDYDCDIVRAVRSICRFFSKVRLDCTPKRVAAAVESFVKTEQEFESLRIMDGGYANLINDFKIASHYLWSSPLSRIDLSRLRFNHGPGATVERYSSNEKYRWTAWPDHFEPFFPFLDSAYTISAHESEDFAKVRFISPEEVAPAKVTAVPKTLRSPRLIAIEPAHNQYVQQGIRDALYRELESDRIVGGQINFHDQSINQSIALESSRSRSFSTIDLKDASDRVPRSLALSMFDCYPDLRDAVDACTSKRASLPSGSVLELRKFASMGNALCFPVEAMYFFTICTLSLLKSYNLPLDRFSVYKVAKSIFVYGDDIIVPVETTGAVYELLELFNCKVNTNKSFSIGYFRESCGRDAYRGEDVTSIYLRRVKPSRRSDAAELLSWVATANDLYFRGYWQTASRMFTHVERILGKLPWVPHNSAAIGRRSFSQATTLQRWNKRLHRFEFKAWVARAVKVRDPLEGYPALTKCLLRLGNKDQNPLPYSEHLEETERRNVVSLKRCWVPSH